MPLNENVQKWLDQGSRLYDAALEEYRALEREREALEQRMLAKRAEVNEIAKLLDKPALHETNHRLSAELIDSVGPRSVPATRDTIARALNGGAIGR